MGLGIRETLHLLSPTARERGSEPTIMCSWLFSDFGVPKGVPLPFARAFVTDFPGQCTPQVNNAR